MTVKKLTMKISKFIKPERTSPKKSPDCEKDLSLIVSMGENRPVDCVPTDPRENRNLLSKLIHSEPGVGEKPPLDGGNHPSGQLLPLPSIRSSLPVGRLRRLLGTGTGCLSSLPTGREDLMVGKGRS